MDEIIIGTRGSQLAQWQANFVKSLIEHNGHYCCRLEVIKTMGDKDHSTPLPEIGSKGFFTAEIEQALRDHTIDLAVHSLKDLPVELEDDLEIGAIPRRGSAMDVIVLPLAGEQPNSIDQPVIATGSNRRKVQLKRILPHADTVDVRGNISTRLKKLERENWDGLIMAKAALDRLSFSENPQYAFNINEMIPSAGQGAIAVQLNKNRTDLKPILEGINHKPSFRAVTAERKLIHVLEGGCQVPSGAYVHFEGEKVCIDGFIANHDGTKMVKVSKSGSKANLDSILLNCIQEFQDRGSAQIIHENRQEVISE